MIYKYSILQLSDTDDSILSKLFMPYDLIAEKFDINDYKIVYEGEINEDTEYTNPIFILEKLFEIFNVRHPKDFHGHSLSTSDIIKLDNDIWYCDSIGWKKIN